MPLGLLLICGGCGLIRTASAPPLRPPMPVEAPLRKQVLQDYMPFGSIGWVNNELVVFSGRPIRNQQKDALYLWNVETSPRLLLKNSPGGCVSRGAIYATQFSEQGKDRRYKIKGPEFIGQLISTSAAPAKSKYDPISCTSIAIPKKLEGRVWKPLQATEGFLDFGPDLTTSGIRAINHFNADLSILQDTGIRMEQPLLPRAEYATHDGSYLVFDLNQAPSERQRWIETNQRRIWRLNRRMQGAPLTVPAGPWVGRGGGTISFLPSRPGLLITSNNFARNRDAGNAGLYLLPPDGAALRLERGLVQKAAVSPDGCRVAYSFEPRLDTGIPEGGPRLVVLDLCGSQVIAKR